MSKSCATHGEAFAVPCKVLLVIENCQLQLMHSRRNFVTRILAFTKQLDLVEPGKCESFLGCDEPQMKVCCRVKVAISFARAITVIRSITATARADLLCHFEASKLT